MFFNPRYVRICYLCQLRDSVLVSERNIRWYKLAIVVFPIIFYLPKFFEVRPFVYYTHVLLYLLLFNTL